MKKQFRSCPVQSRLTPEEYKDVKASQPEHMHFSEYIRELILEGLDSKGEKALKGK